MAITTAYRTRSDALPLRSFKAKGRPSAIAGMGVYAPDKIITNFDLEKMMDTSDKWITERTGIHTRHIAEPGTTTFSLATKAAQGARGRRRSAVANARLLEPRHCGQLRRRRRRRYSAHSAQRIRLPELVSGC